MENDNRNDAQENNKNEDEKHLDTARLNVDADIKTEDLKSDTDPNRYYDKDNRDGSSDERSYQNQHSSETNWSDGPAETSGKESSYRSPEDERAFNTKNTEKYITHEKPDNAEALDADE